MNTIDVLKLGRMAYGQALEIQMDIHEKVKTGRMQDTFILVEHPPVITLGKRGEYDNILLPMEALEKQGIDLFETNRGGDVTYHGLGQIVGYPILNLEHYGRDIHDYVWRIEELFIQMLKTEFDLEAQRASGKFTGVWVGNEKITAIGIAVKRWVTMHGFAFNVNTDLSHFEWIVPCGLTDKGVTSVEKLTGSKQPFHDMIDKTIHYFCKVFEVEGQEICPDSMK